MEKRETKEVVPRYVSITETRCGKCKRLKELRSTTYPFYCEAHREALPEIVVHFFGEACKEFKPK